MDDEIEELWGLFVREGDLEELRRRTAVLIRQALDELRNALGDWETAHLAQAIALLWSNMMTAPPSKRLLGMCLQSIELARTPATERNEHYAPRERVALTHDELLDALRRAYPIGR